MSAIVKDEYPSGTLEIAAARLDGGRRSWFVEVHDETDDVRRVPLTEMRVVVGSGPGADVVVNDRAVSKRHCVLAHIGGRICVQDLGSKNGTYLGGGRVQEAWCTEGATLTIGRATLVCGSVEEGTCEDSDDEEDFRPLPSVVGQSKAMRKVAHQVRRLAASTQPVLIAGESGTGKDLIARALHLESGRGAGPFVPVNMGGVSRELVESELFGHERGAFTGAVARRPGAFADAEGGTLFLDEIGDLPLDVQPKLLRALDGYEVRPIGGTGPGRRPNVRVVAATHVALAERVHDGLFREDLFYRLEVLVVRVPPLRERKEDIGAIARAMMRGERATDFGGRQLSTCGLARLVQYDWPGNVRQLKSVLLRAAAAATHPDWIDANVVDRSLRNESGGKTPMSFTPTLARKWLEQHDGNLSAAARKAGLPRTSFRKLLDREVDKKK
jgi:DNA-binding NtrC family response regulator